MTRLLRVLLVDPNFVVRRTVAGAARDLQLAEVDETASVDGAGALLQAHAYDVLLIDIDADGEALRWLEQVQRAGRLPPVIAMSAAPQAALVMALREVGVTQLLCKPFRIKDLLQRLPRPAGAAADASAPPATLAG